MRRIIATPATTTWCADQLLAGDRTLAIVGSLCAQPADLAIVRRTRSEPTNTHSLIEAYGRSGQFACKTNDEDVTTFRLKNRVVRHHLEA